MNLYLSTMFAFLTTLFSCQQNDGFKSMDVNEFEKLILQDDIQLVDVRTPAEYAEGHLPHSININVMDNAFNALAEKDLSKDKPVAVYCRSGQRSKRAAKALVKDGFKVYELDGGINSWIQAEKKVEK